MFKRELKVNFKSFMIWTIILIMLFLVVFLIYPSIVSSNNIGMMEDMMKMFPQEMLKAFNMDISTIDSAFGWLKTEGFIFVLLVVGCYSAILGSTILLKEENDHTIEYLNSVPITRKNIVISKVLCGIFYIIVMVLVIGIFNYIGLSFSGEFNHSQYLLLSVTPIFSSIVIFFFCLLLSTFTHKSKRMLGISLGIVFISYLFYTLSSLAKEVEFLKYISIFTLADIRHVITDISINPVMVGMSLILSILLFTLTLFRYSRKELI